MNNNIESREGARRESRPQGERPNAEDIKEVIERERRMAGERFGGVDVKLMDYADFLELVARLAEK